MIGFVFSVAGKSSRKWTMRCFDGVVTVVDADNDAHGKYLHFLYSTIYNKRLPFGASGIFAWKKRFIGIVPTNRHWGIGELILTVLSPSDIIYSWLSPPNYEGGERLSFQEIILLLTFIGSCIYATVSLTIKVLAFLLQNKKSRWLGLKSAAKRKHSHKAAIIMKKALRFRKAFLVHHRGLEPRTHWLRVSCSTNWANGAYKREAGIYLFSQAVSSQLSSAQVSLTSVFGMGTGGTSPSSSPTNMTGSV